MIRVSWAPYNIVSPVLLIVSILAAILIDAIRTARKLGNTYELKGYNKWYVYLGLIVVMSFIPDLVRGFYGQAFKIPSGGMTDTLLIGDHIMVSKLAYGINHPLVDGKLISFDPPQRGDIIVFKYPEDESKNFIKRVIGLPDDTIEIRNKQVWINGTPLVEAYVKHVDPNVIPASGQPRDNLAPLRVQPDSYFVLGDNRDQSLDSRFWGFVKLSKILGKASVIYWSWYGRGNAIDWVRWERIGKEIR